MTAPPNPVHPLVKRSLAILALVCCAMPSFASVSVRSSGKKTVDVAIAAQPLSAAIPALEPFLGREVDLLLGDDPIVSYRATRVTPDAALRAIVAAAHVELLEDQGRLWIRDAREPSVTLDVKNADVRTILTSMQKQCGIKNLMIDPQVQGSGTFLFHDVPCRTAFEVALRSLGLSSTTYGNSVMAIDGRTR
jgi:hypothetical protein